MKKDFDRHGKFKGLSAEAKDLIDKCLNKNGTKRLTC